MCIDDLLGRDFTFYRRDRAGTVKSEVTVVAYDPAKGIKLWSRIHGPAWVPMRMFEQLRDEGVLR